MLKKFYIVLFLIVFAQLGCSTFGGSKYKVRDYQVVTLNNGLTIYFIPDDSLPSVSLLALVKSGGVKDPSGKEGLATLVGDLLLKGTQTKNAVQIAEDIDQYGMNIGVSTTADYTVLKGSGLSFYRDELLSNISDVMLNPSFKDNEVRRQKSIQRAKIKSSVDKPGSFASQAFYKYLYGSHPYGQDADGSVRSLNKIKRRDVIRYYMANYRPNNTMIAVVGNFDKTFREKVKKVYGDWKSRTIKAMTWEELPQINGIEILLVDKPGLSQSEIRLGHKGIRRSNPDNLTLKVANTILGGAFASRLNDEIRVRRGLTYSISSYFIPRKDFGPFAVSTFTRHDKVKETLEQTLRVIKEFSDKGVTDEEVKAAKGYMRGVFPRILETAEDLAENLLVLKYFGVKDDYLQSYLGKLSGISTSDVNKVIKKYYDPQNLKVLVYSTKGKAKKQVESLGKVQVKSYKSAL